MNMSILNLNLISTFITWHTINLCIALYCCIIQYCIVQYNTLLYCIVCIGIAASIKQQFSLWKTIRVTTILFPVENLALILVISVPILIKDLYIRLKKKRLQREKQEARWTLWRFLLTLNPRGSSERIWGRKGRREETEPKRGWTELCGDKSMSVLASVDFWHVARESVWRRFWALDSVLSSLWLYSSSLASAVVPVFCASDLSPRS